MPITIYESRPQNAEVFKSGVILTPNGLRVLDCLGVFARIRDRCYVATHRVFKNDKDETIRKSLIANEDLYGYCNHRVWRKILIDEMRQMLGERSIQIKYEAKLNGIVSDDDSGVNFLINQNTHHASMLIGSDGIYSTVRKYLAPDTIPEYTGIVGIMSHIKRASVAWPFEDYERNATIQGKPGAFFFLPEDPQAEDIMIGMQVQYPEQSRQDLERLQEDHDKLVEFYRKDYDQWGPTARSIIDNVTKNKETCYIWPFLKMPTLPRWYSSTGRVIIVGDGAHALPPSSGQGVNQALEDIYSLTLLLMSMKEPGKTNGHNQAQTPNARLLHILSHWQTMRQKRIDTVFDWASNSTNVRRMPEAERKKLIAEGKIKDDNSSQADDMSWLYRPTLEEDVKTWISSEA